MEKPKACEELSLQKPSRQSWNESLGAGDYAWLHSPAPPPPGPLNWPHPRGKGGPPRQQLFSYSFRALKGAVVPTPASKGSQGAKEGRRHSVPASTPVRRRWPGVWALGPTEQETAQETEWTRVDSSPSCATHQLCDLKQATVPLGLQFPIFIFIIF